MAQWKRAGPITQRSVDRNYALLQKSFFIFYIFSYNVCRISHFLNCYNLLQCLLIIKQYIKEGYCDINLCVEEGRRVGIMNHGIQKEGNLNKERASFSCI